MGTRWTLTECEGVMETPPPANKQTTTPLKPKQAYMNEMKWKHWEPILPLSQALCTHKLWISLFEGRNVNTNIQTLITIQLHW